MMTAVTVAIVGAAMSLAALFAQAAGGDGIGAVAPLVQSTALTATVGALVYLARQMVNGNLVAKPVAQVQTETAALVKAGFQRERDLADCAAAAQKREEALSLMLDRTALTLGRATAELERRGAGGV